MSDPDPLAADAIVLQRAFLAGLAVWASATIAFRLFGEHVLREDPAALLILFAVVGLAMTALGPVLRRVVKAAPAQADAAALAMILPGMVLDAGATGLFPEVFPNMARALAPSFGALMLWGYGVAGAAIALEARISSRPPRGSGRGVPPRRPTGRQADGRPARR